MQWPRERGGLDAQVVNVAADLWRLFGVPWAQVDALAWADFVVMTYQVDRQRRAEAAAHERA